MAQPCLLVVVMWISSWQCLSRNCLQLAIVVRCKFLSSSLHSGLFLHSVQFSTTHYIWICWGYGEALSGKLGQLRLIISTLTGALGARGYYRYKRRGSSVRWILLADNLSIWSYQRCGAGAIAVFWQLGIVQNYLILEVSLDKIHGEWLYNQLIGYVSFINGSGRLLAWMRALLFARWFLWNVLF